MHNYFTLDSFDLKDRIVGLRIDINSPVIKSKVVLNERIVKASSTIDELVSKGARVVILAHQGRTGKVDCISLKQHSKLISKCINRKIGFCDLDDKRRDDRILSLKCGEILLLENLRFYDDELDVNKKGNIIKSLERVFDYYVFDAFSVCHRKQTSVVGFSKIPVIAGRLMDRELRGLNSISLVHRPLVYVFGGAKPDDLIPLIEKSLRLKEVDCILLTGVIGEIALHVNGFYLGKKLDFLRENNYLSVEKDLRGLLRKYPKKILFPSDVALVLNGRRVEIKASGLGSNRKFLDKNMINDIGSDTIRKYSLLLRQAGGIYLKGPCGNFELKGCDVGTKSILREIVNSKGFSFVGGGHSVTVAEKFKCLDKFSYVSLAGGALVKFLSNERLFGIEVLEMLCSKFEGREDFIVVGSNVLDTVVSVNEKFSNLYIGEKVRVKDDFKKELGGGGVNMSVCLARLGARVAYLGKISYNEFDFLKERLDIENVRLIESKKTKKPIAKSILLDTKDNDRLIITYRGSNQFLELDNFDYNKFSSNFYYFTALSGESFKTQLELAKIIKKRNKRAKIFYGASPSLIHTEPKLMDLIRICDVIILNYEEACEILGKEQSFSSVLRGLKKLACELVIVTDGANGSYAYDGNMEYFTAAFKPDKIVDTTGAGDCFGATFMYFYSKGCTIKKAMEYAAGNSANVVTKKGPQLGLMYYKDLVKKV